MLLFERLNKIFGVRKQTDFAKPRVINDTEFVLPTNSAIIEYDNEYMNDALYRRTPMKSYVYIADKYICETEGTFKRLAVTTASIIFKLKKNDDDKEFKFVLSADKLWEVPKNKVILIDAYRVKHLYKYTSNVMSEYNEYMNRLSNAIMYTIEPDKLTTRKTFLSINIPKRLPTLAEIKKFKNARGNRIIKEFGNTDVLCILELIKEISGEESVFSVIKNKSTSDLVLLFTINGKITMVNYSYLLSLNNDLMLDTPIKGYSSSKSIRVFMSYLLKISLLSASSVGELENDVSPIQDNASTREETDVDIESMISAHNQSNETVVEIDVENKEVVELDKLMSEEDDPNKNSTEYLNKRLSDAVITEKTRDKILAAATEANNEIINLRVTQDELKIEERQYPTNPTVIEKSMLDTKIDDMTSLYLDRLYVKQQKETIMSAGGGGHVIHNHSVETKEDINNAYEYHSFDIMQPNGRTVSKLLIIPKVDDEGYMKINSTRFKIRKQKADLPIKKTSSTEVALSSYYSKVFIRKAEVNKNNSASSLYKQLDKRTDDDISMLLVNKMEFVGVDIGIQYTTMARKVKSFKIGTTYCNFDYLDREEKFGKDTKYGIPFAKNNKTTYYIDKNNIVKDDKGEEQGTLYKWLKIDERSLAPEYANINLLGDRIPVVLVLIYYYGFKALLKSTRTNFSIHPIREKIELSDKHFEIKFKSEKVIVSKKDKYATILFGALQNMKELREVELNTMDFSSGILDVFQSLGYSIKLPVELDNLVSLWVDPMTRIALEYIKEPLTWKGLIFRSVELLTDNTFRMNKNSSEIMIKGYDRINGMVYNIISKSIRDNEHKVGKVSLKMELNPYELLSVLSEDSTMILEDDLNPLSSLKTKEEVTLTGKFGRSKEAISVRDKVYKPSDVGVISEATKDSKDVAITSYMPLSPKIDNLIGIPNENKSDISNSNIFSSGAVLAPESNKDDGKRMMMISIQNGHKIPTESQRILPVRTGFESVLPYRMDKKFVEYAKEDGEVVKITAKKIDIKYESRTVTYKFASWTSREIGGSAFSHHLRTTLKMGDKVVSGDIIYYDSAFFGPDIMNRKRVVYKGGDTVTVALDESQEVYEDSGSISREFANRFASRVVKVTTLMIKKDYQLFDHIEVGSQVKYSDNLLVMRTMEEDSVDLGFSDKAKAILADQNKTSPKAKAKGKLIKIEIMYNCELEDMSDSVREMVSISDKGLKERTGFTGRVDSSYSVKGNALMEGELEIKYYIEQLQAMQTSDKAVIGNQLKFTVGKVMDEIVDTEGNEIDMKFGYRSIGARVVSNPEIIGTTMLILSDIDKEIINIYFS